MSSSLWSRFRHWMRGSTEGTGVESAAEVTLAEVHTALGEEFRGLRKLLRKQSQMLETLHERQTAPGQASQNASTAGLPELATAFFHLHQSLRERLADSPAHLEAMALFWLHLDRSLHQIGMRMIRETGTPFDARLHRAVLSRGEGSGELMAVEVLEPGFMQGERVITPAKVILAHKSSCQSEDEENQ